VAEELEPEAVVIRFRPTELDSVVRGAQKEHRRTGFHRLSVFAAAPQPDETQEQTEARLVRAAELEGINLESNSKYWVARRGELAAFEFHKDGDDGECPEHYSVDLGAAEGLANACRDFLGKFNGPEKVEQ
jgi:hypothetical protein